MEVILLKKVENLGNLGDKVAVKSGYGRNYLVPTGRAVSATAANLKAFEERRTEFERDAITLLTEAEARKANLADLRITIARRAGNEGRLFGSVSSTDIAVAMHAIGYPVDKHEVRLPKGSLRITGEHDVMVHLHSGVDVNIKVEIVAEE